MRSVRRFSRFSDTSTLHPYVQVVQVKLGLSRQLILCHILELYTTSNALLASELEQFNISRVFCPFLESRRTLRYICAVARRTLHTESSQEIPALKRLGRLLHSANYVNPSKSHLRNAFILHSNVPMCRLNTLCAPRSIADLRMRGILPRPSVSYVIQRH